MRPIDANRRTFIKRTGLVGLGCALGLAGCGDDRGQDSAGKAAAPTDPCDPSTLSEADLALRDSFEYIPQEEDPDLHCDVCEFWVAPPAGQACGGCTLMKGPIQAQGSCNSFSPSE